MNEAALYRSKNGQTRRDAKLILDRFRTTIQWRKDGNDSLLDIGTGSGDVLMDIILPSMPSTFKEIIGSDVSEKMVNFASHFYGENDRVKFEILDIGADEMPEQALGFFDHVTSFYCLHWIQDMSKALRNIHQLLSNDGGDCLLVFIANCMVYDVYEKMAKLPKWSTYVWDFKKFISPLHQCTDPVAEYGRKLQEAGFVEAQVEIQHNFYMYDTQMFRGIIRAVCPFFDRMPVDLHEEFIDEFINIVTGMGLRERAESSGDFQYKSTYTLIIAYARKPMGR